MQYNTCVCKLNKIPQCIGVYAFHFDLFLLGFTNITCKHGSKVVRDRTEDKSAKKSETGVIYIDLCIISFVYIFKELKKSFHSNYKLTGAIYYQCK